MELIKALTELIKALSHFAWPLLVGLIVWWFRKEIRRELAGFIARIAKLEMPGVKIEAREQVELNLDNAKAGISEEKIQEVEKAIKAHPFVGHGSVTVSGSATPQLVEGGLGYLFQLASKN